MSTKAKMDRIAAYTARAIAGKKEETLEEILDEEVQELADDAIGVLGRIDDKFKSVTAVAAIEEICKTHDDPLAFIDRLVSWSSILRGGRYKTTEYIKAVNFCSLRAMDFTVLDAYKRTFPERLSRREAGKRVPKPEGTIRASASIYSTGALVHGIMSQMQIPLHIMMMSQRVKMAMKLADLAMNASSERVQMEAADRLLSHIVAPEVKKMELDIGFRADDTIESINSALDRFSQIAHDRIRAGTITATDVIELEVL